MTRTSAPGAKDPWPEQHREQARDFLRTQLSDALGLHLPLMRAEGHLTKDDILRELAAAMMVVIAMDKKL